MSCFTKMCPRVARVGFALCALAASMVPLSAGAQDYPNRPVRFIVPTAPGGGTDTITRILGRKLSEQLGQQFVIDNRAGGGGSIAYETVARGNPDGYTILMGSISALVYGPLLFPQRTGYDPIRDFAPISLVAGAQFLATISPAVPARTLKDFVAYAKANPGRINFASGGNGTAIHLAGEWFKAMAGLNMVHIPYKGGGPAAAAVLAGEAQFIFGSFPSTLPQVKAGKLITLGVSGARRSPLLPDMPTLAEQGFPGFAVSQWYGVIAPARTPPAIVARLNAALLEALRAPDVREQMTRQGLDLMSSTPAEFADFLARELVQWRRVIKDAGIRAE